MFALADGVAPERNFNGFRASRSAVSLSAAALVARQKSALRLLHCYRLQEPAGPLSIYFLNTFFEARPPLCG